MNARMLRVIVGAAILVLGAARPATAQARPDTDGLARAAASFLADSVFSRIGARDSLFIATPTTAFDSATASAFLAVPGTRAFGRGRPPAYEWIGTRGYTMRGDTAAVLVEIGTKSPSDGRAIDTYIEQNLYLFVREGGGWRFVGREFVRGMDLGPVRG